MRMIRFRVVGETDKVGALIAALREMDKVDRVEEIADVEEHLRDDSSSLGLPDDTAADFHDIELHALNASAASDAHDRIELAARELGVVVEFVDEF